MKQEINHLKNEIARFKKYSEGGREVYFYPHYLILRQLTHPKHPWYVSVGVIGLIKNQRARWYLLAESDDLFNKELNKFLRDPGRLGKLGKFIKSLRDGAISLLEGKPISELSNEDLWKLTEDYYALFEQIFAMTVVLRIADRAVVWKLRDLLKGLQDVDGALAKLAAGEKLSFAMREERVLLGLALKAEKEGLAVKSSIVQSELSNLRDHFCWISCGYYNEPAKTKDMYEAALKDLVGRNPSRLRKEFDARLKKERVDRAAALASLDQSGKELAHIAAESAYLKDSGKFSANEIIYRSNFLFGEIAKRTKHDIDFVKNLLPQEVEQLLSGRQIDTHLVQSRADHSVIVLLPGKEDIHILLGSEAIDLEKQHFTAGESERKEWRGRAASAGYGRGKVKVVLGRRDFGKFEEGNILVATNTSPDFVPIMKKAAAIVAEDGGITAHASVASREMCIPAVVGIAHATQLLRDGDEVEVDAVRGVVKKL